MRIDELQKLLFIFLSNPETVTKILKEFSNGSPKNHYFLDFHGVKRFYLTIHKSSRSLLKMKFSSAFGDLLTPSYRYHQILCNKGRNGKDCKKSTREKLMWDEAHIMSRVGAPSLHPIVSSIEFLFIIVFLNPFPQ